MSIQHAIEKLQETGEIQDRQHAATLSGVLAARGADIPLPEDALHESVSEGESVTGYLGKVSFLDDAEKAPHLIPTDELDAITTERYALSDSAKQLLSPYYAAASLKVPLARDNPKSILGRPKTGKESLSWNATRRTTTGNEADGKVEAVTVSHEFDLEYQQGKAGNTPLRLSSQLHVDGYKQARHDPELSLEFEDAAVSSLTLKRGRDNNSHMALGLEGYLDDVYECDIKLNPGELGLAMKYDVLNRSVADSYSTKDKVEYKFDPKNGTFVATGYKKAVLGRSSLPAEISSEEFLGLIQSTVEAFVPTQ